MTPDLAVDIAGVRLKNPVTVASGTFGYGEEFADFIDLDALGGIVTKSITLHERQGHPPPRTCETAAGMLNAIGLANVGIERFIDEKIPFLKKLKTVIIVNVAGSSLDEYVEVCRQLEKAGHVDMIELTVSCPNVADYRRRRDVLHAALVDAGFDCSPPEGAYYILADFSALSDEDDDTFARRLAAEAGVATVPGSSFFHDPVLGRDLVRFAFCKRVETLEAAGERLRG